MGRPRLPLHTGLLALTAGAPLSWFLDRGSRHFIVKFSHAFTGLSTWVCSGVGEESTSLEVSKGRSRVPAPSLGEGGKR